MGTMLIELAGDPLTNARPSEKDTCLHTEHFFIFHQSGNVDSNRTCLPARNGKIRWVFVETKWLTPSTFSSL
jgi:hypothetical protein